MANDWYAMLLPGVDALNGLCRISISDDWVRGLAQRCHERELGNGQFNEVVNFASDALMAEKEWHCGEYPLVNGS